jgi:hypothetical protein
MKKVYHQFSEHQDKMICTFVRLYRFNVSYGLKRASEFLGLRLAVVISRYYNHLRNTRQIFSVEFGDQVIWNTRAISSKELDSLVKYEKINVPESEYSSLEKRAWWKE